MRVRRTDVLIVGSGAAGLRAGIEARNLGVDVLLVSKERTALGNCTAISEGWLNAALAHTSPADNPEVHFKDTLAGGRFVNDPKLAKIFANGACSEILKLEQFGVSFEKKGNKFVQLAGPGHRYPRACLIVSPRGKGGLHLVNVLKNVAQGAGVKFIERVMVVDLIKSGDLVAGAVAVDLVNGGLLFIECKSTILATGGGGAIYKYTSCPLSATADGCAMAYRAGAKLRDMEFVQFYPVVSIEKGLPRLTLPYGTFIEAGGVLRNARNEDIVQKYGLGSRDKITRDQLALAIGREIHEGRGIDDCVLLDLTSVPEERYEQMRRMGARLNTILSYPHFREKPIHVAPGAHYFMGGVIIDEKCETNLHGLYAAGEVVGGPHGANRLGANALPEALVFGARAGKSAAEHARSVSKPPTVDMEAERKEKGEMIMSFLRHKETKEVNSKTLKDQFRTAMSRLAGIIRSDRSLKAALSLVQEVKEDRLPLVFAHNPVQLGQALEIVNLVDVGEMIIRSALIRKESRGAHYRLDYPQQSDEWLTNTLVVKSEKMSLSMVPARTDLP